jgi:glycosyltransferase involved in cell wall biosynthesis
MVPRLIKVFRQYKPHIVHFYFKISFLGRIAAKLAGIPIIICNEVDMDWEEYGLGLAVTAKFKRKLDFLADKVIACSQAVKDYWDQGGNSRNFTVINLPIDIDKFKDNYNPSPKIGFKNDSGPVLGMVSRIFPGKGHEYIIKAMPQVLNQFPTARLRIVGIGPLLAEMQELASSLNLMDSIEFTGFVEDLAAELAKLDLFILPSLSEGFPLSVLEAMAAGLPVAATPVGGTPEIIEHGKTGLLFGTKDSAAISDAVISLLSDYEKALAMGKQGYEKAMREYSPATYSKKLDALYQKLLRDKGLI